MSLLAYASSHDVVKSMETTWNGEAESIRRSWSTSSSTVHPGMRNKEHKSEKPGILASWFLCRLCKGRLLHC